MLTTNHLRPHGQQSNNFSPLELGTRSPGQAQTIMGSSYRWRYQSQAALVSGQVAHAQIRSELLRTAQNCSGTTPLPREWMGSESRGAMVGAPIP